MAASEGMGRRDWLIGVGVWGGLLGSSLLSACGRKPAGAPGAKASKPGDSKPGDATHPQTLDAAASGGWRSGADKRRDPWRHPAETLAFFGVRPGSTVVELWPGTGWYTDILAPFLNGTGGTLYEADFQLPNPDDPAAQSVVDSFKAKLLAKPDLYGKPVITAFGPASGPLCPPGAADVVLFLRNFHNWMGAGLAEKALKDALACLKPGGVLGVEEHRAGDGAAQDPLASTGYVQQRYMIQMAQEAGFRFEAASELNANPKDNHEHPFGVWTLPPTRRSSPRGAPPNPKFDHRPYDAIGESDRMTLRFRKP